MSNPKDYTVGWVCAIRTEYVAARAFLDEKHDPVESTPSSDDNVYTLGKVGKHNVVISVLPNGEYGIAAATSVVTNMLNSFPNIRFGLMVGIGGGAPSRKHDIRLGDIVVSTPYNEKGGVLQYDFGKKIQEQKFRMTGFLNKPPMLLQEAVINLSAKYEEEGHQLEEAINTVLKKMPRLQKKYGRPDQSSDRLYQSYIVHPLNNESDCIAVCGDNISAIIQRSNRTKEDNPTIHYGLIASGSQLMKDALMRDKFATKEDILCFEMEAAGLMNYFPCLVIRGVSDYSDSHKNKEWQGYAAMAAAAYAKDLLSQIPPTKIEAEKRIIEVLSGLQDIAQEQLSIAQEQLNIQKQTADQELSNKQAKCLQLFYLTNNNKDATYEWYKDRLEDQVSGTCQWFLKHENFQRWLKETSGPLLVSADPGCGKSVLAKYLINNILPQSASICYFFFKDQDQNTICQALCALLHQLFKKKKFLLQHAIEQLDKDGPGLINSKNSLWTIFENAIKDPRAGPIIIVLDALDECAELEFRDLIYMVENQFRNTQNCSKLKYLLTSRPYEQVLSKFHFLLNDFPYIRIPGEEKSDEISLEVNLVIQNRVKKLRLPGQIKSYLSKKLLEITHRTYLWVHLVFDYLKSECFKKTIRGIEDLFKADIPKNVNEAYERMLNRSKDDPMVRKTLSIVLAATRPLTISEMNIAVNINNTSRFIEDVDIETEEDFKSRLKSWCGLFISIHHGKVYFLHQTAREFLLNDLQSPITTCIPDGLNWQHSITTDYAHSILAEICIRYLNFFSSSVKIETGHDSGNIFLDYSAINWGFHFREAHNSNNNNDLVSIALKICDPRLTICSTWFDEYWQVQCEDNPPNDFTTIMISSYFGHEELVRLLLEQGTNIETRDNTYGRTPLLWAAMERHEAVVQLLLKNGANIEAQNKEGCTPLLWAAMEGHEMVVKLLLEQNTNMETQDNIYSWTPLSWAVRNGYQMMLMLLLEQKANIEAQDTWGRTPLLWAAKRGHKGVVKLLLEKKANIKAQNVDGQTPLLLAAQGGHEMVVKLLLAQKANIDARDKGGRTPLLWAAMEGHEMVVKLLLEQNTDMETQDNIYGWTPLSWAARNGYHMVVKLLLEQKANIEAQDKGGRTPLLWAARNGYQMVVKLLLEQKANIEAQNVDCQTPLLLAAQGGHEMVVKLLLAQKANIDARDKGGRTPLLWAARNGREMVVKLLLEQKANIEAQDKVGRTPLLWAARNGREMVVKLLLEQKANMKAQDMDSQTPLLLAAIEGHKIIVKLLEQNINMEI